MHKGVCLVRVWGLWVGQGRIIAVCVCLCVGVFVHCVVLMKYSEWQLSPCVGAGQSVTSKTNQSTFLFSSSFPIISQTTPKTPPLRFNITPGHVLSCDVL